MELKLNIIEGEIMNNYFRFLNDVNYNLLVPPLGLNFSKMTPKQARDNYDWFISKIPERMDYFRKKCTSDLNISINSLDYSFDSLVLVWKWFIKIARMEKTPKEELEKMREGAMIFGDSFLNYTQFTVATEYILRDIGMYIGQTFVTVYPQLHWHLVTKPKNDIDINQPVIAGFKVKIENSFYDATLNPISVATGQAANFYDNSQNENDVYNFCKKWQKYIL